jgi:putative transposon-encoded protein
MNLTDTESIKHIQNKLDLKRMFEIEKKAVIAETELEAVYIKQVTSKGDTSKIRSIIESFNELRWEMNRYRAMYLNELDIRLSDKERYELRITELERQINIETL